MKIKALSVICSLLQILGLILIVKFAVKATIPSPVLTLIGIAGFAGIVNFFLPMEKEYEKILVPVAAFAGLGTIIFVLTI